MNIEPSTPIEIAPPAVSPELVVDLWLALNTQRQERAQEPQWMHDEPSDIEKAEGDLYALLTRRLLWECSLGGATISNQEL